MLPREINVRPEPYVMLPSHPLEQLLRFYAWLLPAFLDSLKYYIIHYKGLTLAREYST